MAPVPLMNVPYLPLTPGARAPCPPLVSTLDTPKVINPQMVPFGSAPTYGTQVRFGISDFLYIYEN